MSLPIEPVLPQIAAALEARGMAVLAAPPGAGKTTRVPLYLDATIPQGRILMLEPRRVAARGAALRMAESRGEKVGASVGYRMRGDSKVSAQTRIEVITEGVLTRMIQSDPELTGIGTIIFDEFHERALQADLGLALALEVRAALRPDLRLLVMSATLDTAAVAGLLDNAPVIRSEGRAFAVETVWAERPPKGRIEAETAALVRRALAENEGSVLVFLPGQAEILRTQRLLADLPAEIAPLYGALPFKAQLAALAPPEAGQRKVVLATAIAETSLTIPDVRAVVDAGRARRPRFDPGKGMTRLVTETVSRAEAEQRAGRAGRVAPGRCYRLWTRGAHGGLPPFAPVEIAEADLTGLALDLAEWGAGPEDLPFLTPPPAAAFAEAQSLLRTLGAIDDHGLTAHGAALARLPLHPRLGHMLLRAEVLGQQTSAARLALLIEERGGAGPRQADAAARLRALLNAPTASVRTGLKRLAPKPDREPPALGALLSLAYPDRIAQRRPGNAPRYLLSGGAGAVLDAEDALGASTWLAVADLDGDRREARIRLAAPLTLSEIRALHPSVHHDVIAWDARARKVVAERQERLGALVLERARLSDPDPGAVLAAMLDGVRALGIAALPWSRAAQLLRARAAFGGHDLGDDALMAALDDWLGPWLAGCTSAADLAQRDLVPALESWLGHDTLRALDSAVPARVTTPTGSRIAIDYSGDQPKLSVRLQEMLGTTTHPVIGRDRIPLLIELLSPASRPIGLTQDLPGFWQGGYKDLRKDMRGRYPRHDWPEDPAEALPTRRAKAPRKRK